MTRADPLENALWRAGLTSAQVKEIMPAINDYATAQARLAIDALGHHVPPAMHLQGFGKVAGPACGVQGVCTTERARVTCGRCKDTRAWKEAA